jgi:hypothetical protein
MSLAIAQEELGIIDEIYCLIESKEIDELTLLQIDKAANADDLEGLKRILERIR